MRKLVSTSMPLLFLLIVTLLLIGPYYYSLHTAMGFSLIDTIAVRIGPHQVAFDPINSWIYVTNTANDTISVIKDRDVIAIISDPSFRGPLGIAFNPANGYIYVTNIGSVNTCGDTVSVIDRMTVIQTIPVGPCPLDIEFNPTNNKIYVTNYLGGSVSLIDSFTHSVTDTLPVASGPQYIAFNEADGRMYVPGHLSGLCDRVLLVCTPSSLVTVIKDNIVEANIPLNPANTPLSESYRLPTAIAFNPINKMIYVTIDRDIFTPNTVPYRIILLDGDLSSPSYRKVTDVIESNDLSQPYGIEFNPYDGYMYVTNKGAATVMQIKNDMILNILPLSAPGPWGLAPAPNGLYVANSLSNTVSLLSYP